MEKKNKVGNPRPLTKNVYKFGYKYTQEEAKFIDEVLAFAKLEHKTTSKSILEILKFYKENKKS